MAVAHLYSFGTLLKHYRRELAITQQALAERAGYSAVYIGMLERGERLPSAATLTALADALALDEQRRGMLLAAVRTVDNGEASILASASTPFGMVDAGLVGRSQEMARLQRHLRGDGPPLLALTGEPGIGKTRLLDEVVRLAPAYGWTVLVGGSHLQSGQEPFSPILEALERYLLSQSTEALRSRLTGCEWLIHLLPELAEVAVPSLPAWRISPEQERRLMFKAVSRFLTNIAGPMGTLVVLDDIQWASVDGLDLLGYLVRAPHTGNVRVVSAYRSTDIRPEEPLSILLTDLLRAGFGVTLDLHPLASEDATSLLQSLVHESLGEREQVLTQVVARAGGMPLYLVSFAQALRSISDPTEHTLDAIPSDLMDGVRQRLAALSKQARALLCVAAVAGRQVPRSLLMRVLSQQAWLEDQALTALEEVCLARLLLEDGEAAYRFSHDLVHEALLADMSMARRAVLHRQVAEALELGVPTASAETLAYHYLCGGEEERAAFYLERAGDHALALRAHAEAARAYREVANHLEALDHQADAATVWEKLGTSLKTVAQYDEALDALEKAFATHRSNHNVEAMVRVCAQIGEVHALRGTAQDGIARIELLLSSLRGDHPSTKGMAALYVTLAWLINTTGQYADALRTAQEAAHLAAEADDAVLLLQANLRRGHLLLMLEQVDEGVAVLQDAIPIAMSSGDLRGLRFALNSIGWIHELRGNFAEDKVLTERALGVAEQLDDPSVLAFMRSNHGSPAFNLGDWKAARADFEAGLLLMRDVGESWASAWPPLLLGQLCLAEGQQERADALLQEAISLAERAKDLEAQRWAHGALAERDLLNGAPDAVLARLNPLLDRPGQREIDVCALLPLVARAHIALGQSDVATTIACQTVARASTAGMRPALAHALHARGLAACSQGQWEEARADLLRGLRLCHAMAYPYGQAKILYALGVLYACQANEANEEAHTEARRYFTEALGILLRLGERLYAAKIHTILAGHTQEEQVLRRYQ